MAICVRGFTNSETAALTEAMIRSGGRLSYPPDWTGLVGYHSTGGVGDKVSMVLVPALASCGLRVCLETFRPPVSAMNTLVQLLAVYTNPESHNAQRHRQTDRWTDGQTDRRTTG